MAEGQPQPSSQAGSSLVRAGESPNIVDRLNKLRTLLVSDERLECQAVQRRVYALDHRRIVVACTSGRLLIMRPNLLPGFAMDDIRWQDLRNAQLREGIFGSTLTIETASGTYAVMGLRKEETERVYRFCQSQEQAWREKNRVREMEEARARAGGVQINSASPTVAADDARSRLQKAKEMLDAGLISDTEYESAKAKILSSI